MRGIARGRDQAAPPLRVIRRHDLAPALSFYLGRSAKKVLRPRAPGLLSRSLLPPHTLLLTTRYLSTYLYIYAAHARKPLYIHAHIRLILFISYLRRNGRGVGRTEEKKSKTKKKNGENDERRRSLSLSLVRAGAHSVPTS